MRVLVVVLALAFAALPSTAWADPPPNDSFANATVVDPGSLPFSDSVDMFGATIEGGEPFQCQGGLPSSVWYAITPTRDGVIQVDNSNSQYYSVLSAWTGPDIANLSPGGCAFYFGVLNVDVKAGTTYYFQVTTFGGSIQLNARLIAPPPDDDFADALAVDPSQLPYSDKQDGTAAGPQHGEPAPSCGSPVTHSWWYSFTPTATHSYTLGAASGQYNSATSIAVYTGDSLSSLTEQTCGQSFFSPNVVFHADAGTTYHIQLNAPSPPPIGVLFQLAPAPDAVAQFGYSIPDPSSFDTEQFYDFSYDPAGAGIKSETWAFGDGTSVVTTPTQGPGGPTHRYKADGDYTAKLTLTTTDGRTATASQQISVRTHDVAITGFDVPTAGRPNKSAPITVSVQNHRYPDTVRVELLKSVAGDGFVDVGTLTQSVPVKSGKKTTDFPFSYTFTADDADAGKVTFEAVATIVNARDALPADNTVIALPTKVRAGTV